MAAGDIVFILCCTVLTVVAFTAWRFFRRHKWIKRTAWGLLAFTILTAGIIVSGFRLLPSCSQSIITDGLTDMFDSQHIDVIEIKDATELAANQEKGVRYCQAKLFYRNGDDLLDKGIRYQIKWINSENTQFNIILMP